MRDGASDAMSRGRCRLARRVAAALTPADENIVAPLAALGRVYPRYARAHPPGASPPPGSIDLGIGGYFDPPAEAIEAARDALARGFTRYLDLPELRRAIAAKLRDDNGIAVDPEREILVLGGARTGIILTCLALVEEGDEVLLFDPDYVGMAHCARLAGGCVVGVPLRATPAGFTFDPGGLERRIGSATRLIMLSNPNNPTGYLYSADDLAAIAAMARRHDLMVLSNELYDALVYDQGKHISIVTLPGMQTRTITVQGVSKVLDMTGFRIGWVIAHGELLEHLADLRFVAALALPPAASQFAAAAALAPEVRRRHRSTVMRLYEANREATVEAVHGYLGVSCPRPPAGHFAFADIGMLTSDDVALAEFLCREAAVQTVPGSVWGRNGRGHLRLTLANAPGVQREGLERLRRGLALWTERHGGPA